MSTEANIKFCKEVFEEKSFFHSADHYDVMADTVMFSFTLLRESINTVENNALKRSYVAKCKLTKNVVLYDVDFTEVSDIPSSNLASLLLTVRHSS